MSTLISECDRCDCGRAERPYVRLGSHEQVERDLDAAMFQFALDDCDFIEIARLFVKKMRRFFP